MKKLLTISFLFYLNTLFSQTVGLFTQTAASQDGYVLFAPTRSDTTYLIDKCGKKIHQWSSTYTPGLSVYLLPDGSLLRTGHFPNSNFNAPGGIIERYDWNNNLLWSYVVSDSLQTQDHDIYPLPNGNIMLVVLDKYSPIQAILAGRDPSVLSSAIWSTKLVEIQPVGTNMANIVWQWRLWDHLVQEFDSTKANYGAVADHPELLDLNFTGANPSAADWIHMNAVTYNEALNQVMFSSHALSEIYIIDHSTTTSEAASHSGGVHGKGGDFLYRWGNPASYNRGTAIDRKLYLQHSPIWIPPGYPDGNKIMIFNNGVNRPGGNSSSIDIISPPVDNAGNYSLTAGLAYAPINSDWSYFAPVPGDFYSNIMGGAQRLPNGNTLICEATKGNFFEIDTAENIVWDYVNPVNNFGPITQGSIPTSNNSFRSVYYPVNYIGFAGLILTPGEPIELNPLPYSCTMGVTTGVNHLSTINPLSVSVSNPFDQTICLSSVNELKNLSVILYSLTGSVVNKWNGISVAANSQVNLSISQNISDGVYFLNYSNSEINGNKKVVKINK